MNYEETLAYIHNTPKFSRILGNELLSKLLQHLGNPQNELKFIHIAGTNGKGSTAAMLSEILTEAGYKTGLFTSPYIERFNERIKINNIDISDTELAEIATTVRSCIEKFDCPVSEFALDTAIAFLMFKHNNCDIVILETGMGGRLDATNVISESLISIITSVSLDHTQYLGDTIEEIAYEKAGIIKESGKVVIYPENSQTVIDIITDVCKKKKTEFYIPPLPDYLTGTITGYEYIRPSLSGDYQLCNAAVVIKAAELLNNSGFTINSKIIKSGIEHTFWPARLEFLSDDVILDGAHNPDAIQKLCTALAGMNKKICPVIAMMEDKAIDECLLLISKHFKKVITTQIDMPRCQKASELANKFKKLGVEAVPVSDPVEAVNAARYDSTACVMGSLYLAGKIRKEFNKKNS